MEGRWTVRPHRWTGATALTGNSERDMASAQVSAVISPVSGSTSANTTSAPTKRAALAVARKVMVGTTTASPGPTPAAIMARCRAAVPLAQATACAAPVASQKARSNSSTRGPVVSMSERRASATAAMSSSSMVCRP